MGSALVCSVSPSYVSLALSRIWDWHDSIHIMPGSLQAAQSPAGRFTALLIIAELTCVCLPQGQVQAHSFSICLPHHFVCEQRCYCVLFRLGFLPFLLSRVSPSASREITQPKFEMVVQNDRGQMVGLLHHRWVQEGLVMTSVCWNLSCRLWRSSVQVMELCVIVSGSRHGMSYQIMRWDPWDAVRGGCQTRMPSPWESFQTAFSLLWDMNAKMWSRSQPVCISWLTFVQVPPHVHKVVNELVAPLSVCSLTSHEMSFKVLPVFDCEFTPFAVKLPHGTSGPPLLVMYVRLMMMMRMSSILFSTAPTRMWFLFSGDLHL